MGQYPRGPAAQRYHLRFIHRCQHRFIFPQNLHFHAVCGGPVIRRISGFQLHGFHCTGKPLGKMLGDSRITCAASEQRRYILLCSRIQQTALPGQDFPQIRGKLVQIGGEIVGDGAVARVLPDGAFKLFFAFRPVNGVGQRGVIQLDIAPLQIGDTVLGIFQKNKIPYAIGRCQRVAAFFHDGCGFCGWRFLYWFFLPVCLCEPFHISHDLLDKGGIVQLLRFCYLPVYNAALGQIFPDCDRVYIVQIVPFSLCKKAVLFSWMDFFKRRKPQKGGLGVATPTRFPQDKIERLAKFGTVVESCSKKVTASAVWASLNTFSAASGDFAKTTAIFLSLIPTNQQKGKWTLICRNSPSLLTTPRKPE
ncbi:hypothetical protein [Acutalibacter sp. JLR.KK004]|uniref:hypothetical protein n=1 Tax=Acutalibacter sp. JLR.KK004 TaxID=3112622 RepID=UPI002FF42120